jgi:hypothetical protein
MIYLEIRLAHFLCGDKLHFYLLLYRSLLYENFLKVLTFQNIFVVPCLFFSSDPSRHIQDIIVYI